MLNEEPVHERDRLMVAMLKPLGIKKGKPFQPEARQKQILAQAAIVGESMTRCLHYTNCQPEAMSQPSRLTFHLPFELSFNRALSPANGLKTS